MTKEFSAISELKSIREQKQDFRNGNKNFQYLYYVI
jgi:hypothetical protein